MSGRMFFFKKHGFVTPRFSEMPGEEDGGGEGFEEDDEDDMLVSLTIKFFWGY